MKKIFVMIAAALLSAPVYAGSFVHVEAQVVSVTETTRVVQRQVCDRQPVTVEDTGQAAQAADRSPMGMILGAVIGGLAGHQVGKGTGQTAATLVAAGAGAYVGDKMANGGPGTASVGTSRTEYRQSCSMVNDTVPNGYDVVYRLEGRDYTTHTSRSPGRTLRLAVSVAE